MFQKHYTPQLSIIVKNIIVNTVVVYLSFALFAYIISNKLIFVPPQPTYHDSSKFLKLVTSDYKSIMAFYLPNKKAKYTMLISHGNAEDIGHTMLFAQDAYDYGFSVFIYDYHGYGLSDGFPSEHNSYLDINAAYDYLTKTLKIQPQNIIVYGHSLGAAIALDLAIRKPVAAVILQGPFVSAFRVMTKISVLPFDKFENLKKIRSLKYPLLIIHGIQDKTVHFWHGKKLYDEAKTSKQFYIVKNAGHNNILEVAGKEYWQKIDSFLKTIQ